MAGADFTSKTSAVIRLDPCLQIYVDVHDCHLRSSRYFDDRGAAKGVRHKLYVGFAAFPYLPCWHDRKDNIIWECNHGGQVWSANAEYAANSSFPVGFCTAGFSSLYTAFVISLLADLGFQVRSRSDHRKLKTCAQF